MKPWKRVESPFRFYAGYSFDCIQLFEGDVPPLLEFFERFLQMVLRAFRAGEGRLRPCGLPFYLDAGHETRIRSVTPLGEECLAAAGFSRDEDGSSTAILRVLALGPPAGEDAAPKER